MVAWVVEAPARARLAAFTAGAWPGLPNLLASHHLQGLLRLDAGAAPLISHGSQVLPAAVHLSALLLAQRRRQHPALSIGIEHCESLPSTVQQAA